MVTTAPGARARALRQLAGTAAARVVFLLAYLGHTLVLLAGAVDAIVCAWLGVPRVAVSARRLRAALNKTWKE